MTGPRVDPTGNIDLGAPAPSTAPVAPPAAPPRAGGGAGPDVELELAKLANDAMAQHPEHAADITDKLHQSISYLRQFPKMAEHATNALSDGVATPADISRTLWPHVQAMSHATGPNAPTAAESADLPMDETAGSRFGGGLANAISEVPGGEALTAGLHAVAHGEPYRESLKTVQAAEKQTPAVVRVPLRLAGGAAAMSVLPGSAPLQAARYGLANGVMSANPDEGLADRLKSGATQAAVGAAVGKAAGTVTNLGRAIFAKPLDENAVQGAQALSKISARNYGRAAAEGASAASAPTPQVLVDALDKPDIKPYAQMIRTSRAFPNADDATVARETYKLMSKQQGGLAQRLKENGFDAATQLSHDNIGLAKQELLQAASSVMPSFPTAVEQHAAMKGVQGAYNDAADATKRAISGTQVAGKKLVTKSPAAFAEAIKSMTPEQAAAATQGSLGTLKNKLRLTPNPLTGFGIAPSLGAVGRTTPLLDLMDARAGNRFASAAAPVSVAAVVPRTQSP